MALRRAGARVEAVDPSGVGHLAAVMPVPSGVGPVTVSALLERTVHFAER
jgi:5,10-methylene-tetrahydrofolate dehydrogenase/methenyl tetrahydrofolate cyclohydrolase